MEIVNSNVPESIFQILKDNCFKNYRNLVHTNEDLKIGIIYIENLDMNERLILRKMINEGVQHIIMVSSTGSSMSSFAWKIGVFHYIEFPFTSAQLKLLYQKVESRHQNYRFLNKKIKLGYVGGFDFIAIKNINFIIGEGNYCKVFSMSQEGKTYTYRIKKFEEALKDELNIVKLTKSIIVNLNNVAQISGNKIKFLESKVTLEISERATKVLKNNLFWINI